MKFVLLFKLMSIVVAHVCTFVIVWSAWIAFTVVSITTLFYLNVILRREPSYVMVV